MINTINEIFVRFKTAVKFSTVHGIATVFNACYVLTLWQSFSVFGEIFRFIALRSLLNRTAMIKTKFLRIIQITKLPHVDNFDQITYRTS